LSVSTDSIPLLVAGFCMPKK